MGSELKVITQLGKGSTFYFMLTFPRGKCRSGSVNNLNGLDVVIAVDSDISRDALLAITQNIGWNPCVVMDRAAVLDRVSELSQQRPGQQVVILDWQIPVKGGLEVAREIHTRLLGKQRPVIVMTTAYSRERFATDLDIRFADAVLTNPITVPALKDAVEAVYKARLGIVEVLPTIDTHRLQGLRILVVDDSDINLEVAGRIFEAEGALVSLANDGQDALNWLASHNGVVDIVLMDVQMPVMNGYEATRRIHDVAAWNDLPVVALTAGAFLEHQELAGQAGMSGFISKPFDVDKAVALIQKLTGHIPVANPVPDKPLAQRPPTDTENLPGIAVRKALKIWRDAEKFQIFLRKFADHYAGVVQNLRDADAFEGQAIAHKFRGAAANLGLEDVASIAQSVEQGLKQGEVPHEALHDLQKAMVIALGSIAAYAPPTSQEAPRPEGDETLLVEWLQRLMEAWHSDSSSNVERVLADMVGALSAERLGIFETALHNYDFRTGEAATAALLHSLGASEGES
jgi:CheY-like chemotaxis protein